MNSGRANKLRIGVAALVTFIVVSPYALADKPLDADTITRTVDVRGLDLSSQAGAARAYKLIRAAARSVCRGTEDVVKGISRVRQLQEHAKRCYDAAMAGALAEVTEATGIDLERVAGVEHAGRERLVAGR